MSEVKKFRAQFFLVTTITIILFCFAVFVMATEVYGVPRSGSLGVACAFFSVLEWLNYCIAAGYLDESKL